MFWLNWKTNTRRRDNQVGHFLVWDRKHGMCLGTPHKDGPSKSPDDRDPDGDGTDGLGYFPESAGTPGRFLYLGTAIAGPGKVVVNMPGCRMLWNMYNRLPYNDWRTETLRYIGVNRLRGVPAGLNPAVDDDISQPMQLDPLAVDIWHHQYVNPTGQRGNPWYFSHPFNGYVRMGICGPLQLRPYHKQAGRQGNPEYEMCPTQNNHFLYLNSKGEVDCSYKHAVLAGISKPHIGMPGWPTPLAYTVAADRFIRAGFNEIEIRNLIDLEHLPAGKQYTFLGTGDTHYLYERNYGAVVSADDPDVELIQSFYPGTLVQDECTDPAGTLRGWGMRGNC